MNETPLKRKAQIELLHAAERHDVLHLIDTIQDIGPNRWVSLCIAGNERTAAVRIEDDGRLTGFLGKCGDTGAAEILRGWWAPYELIGAIVAWMESGLGGPDIKEARE